MRSRKNSTKKQKSNPSLPTVATLPITNEQKRIIESQLEEQNKLEADLSSPISTGVSLLLHIFLIQISNRLAFENPHRLMELENIFLEVDRLEQVYKDSYGAPIQESFSTVKLFENWKSQSTNNMDAYQMAFRNLLKLITTYAECVSNPLSFDQLQILQGYNITTLYPNLLDARANCFSNRSLIHATLSSDKAMRYKKDMVLTVFGVVFKFLAIDPIVQHLYLTYNREVVQLPETYEDAKKRIEELKITNKALKSWTNKNRFAIFVAAVLYIIAYHAYHAHHNDEHYPEFTMLAVYGYLNVFVNIIKLGAKMWNETWFKVTLEQRKKFLRDIMPDKDMYELTTQEGNLLETSFMTLKIRKYKELSYAIVSQIIKNELLRNGVKIEDYKENAIIIRADSQMNSALIEKIKNNIRDRLEEQAEAIRFSQQISQLADHLRDEQLQPIKETIIPQVNEFGKPYYCVYLKVPKYYLIDRIIDGEQKGPILDLHGCFDADIEELKEEGIYKISGAKSANYMFDSDDNEEIEGFRALIQDLLDANQAFQQRKEQADNFKHQIEVLSQRLHGVNNRLKFQLEYGKDALPYYVCSLPIPDMYKSFVSDECLKKIFPEAEIQSIKGGFNIQGYRGADNHDIECICVQIEKMQTTDKTRTADANINNNANPLKRSKNDLPTEIPVKVEKKPIIDFGNGITYDPNIPEGCEILQSTCDPTQIDVTTFNKSAYILFNNTIYYFDVIDNRCSVLNLDNAMITEVKNKLNLQEDATLTTGFKVLKESLTRKELNNIFKITGHEHHEQEVAPFEEAGTSLPRCTFFFRRLSSVMTVQNFIKDFKFDESVAAKAHRRFNKMTKDPGKAKGRFGGQGVIFLTVPEPITNLAGEQVNATVKLKTLGFFGDARVYAVASKSIGPNNRCVLYTPVFANPHAHD